MIAKLDSDIGEHGVQQDSVPVYAIREVPVTAERKPWFNSSDSKLPHPGKLFSRGYEFHI
jgi:peroxygenase